MCGRFALKAPAAELATLFDVSGLVEAPPRFNIAPSMPVLVVRQTGGNREVASLRWGLVPSWAADPVMGNRLANARAETAADRPAFRQAFRSRRCLIPASGFYEWQRPGKIPIYIRPRDDRPFALAGLWECWRDKEGLSLETCTILTTTANDLIRPIHDRMPVIVAPTDFTAWLDARTALDRIQQILRPCPDERLVYHPVSRFVNDPNHDEPRCLEPVPASDQPADTGGWLFGNPA